jgi:hypothetical protein
VRYRVEDLLYPQRHLSILSAITQPILSCFSVARFLQQEGCSLGAGRGRAPKYVPDDVEALFTKHLDKASDTLRSTSSRTLRGEGVGFIA